MWVRPKKRCLYYFRILFLEETETVLGEWLDFVELDHRRLDCIYADFKGEFYREKTKSYRDPFSDEDKEMINEMIKKVSDLLQQHNYKDCTKLFKYKTEY